MTTTLCFVDTETTGLHQDKQLWEVAIIRRAWKDTGPNVGVYEETRYEAFVPVDLSNADLFGLNVGRFYERHPLGRQLSGKGPMDKTQVQGPRHVAETIARFTHGARFIGAAPSFDAEVLGDFLRKHGLLPTWHHRLVDTHDLLTGYILGKGWVDPSRILEMSKDDKVEMLRLKPHTDPKLVHTAMGDAQHEADIWDAVMA